MWEFLLPIIGSLAYNLLFGGSGEQKATQETGSFVTTTRSVPNTRRTRSISLATSDGNSTETAGFSMSPPTS